MGVVHPPQSYEGRATEDGSAVRLVRPNGANTRLTHKVFRCDRGASPPESLFAGVLTGQDSEGSLFAWQRQVKFKRTFRRRCAKRCAFSTVLDRKSTRLNSSH